VVMVVVVVVVMVVRGWRGEVRTAEVRASGPGGCESR